jgi:MFS family permease
VLFSLPAGVWVDRLRRRPILILADVGRGISLASIPLAYLTSTLTIWQLYVVGFVNGVMTVFFDIAYQSYLPSLVERKQINDGNAKLETSRSVAQIAGPGFAGALIAAFTAPIAIVVDSLSFASPHGSSG